MSTSTGSGIKRLIKSFITKSVRIGVLCDVWPSCNKQQIPHPPEPKLVMWCCGICAGFNNAPFAANDRVNQPLGSFEAQFQSETPPLQSPSKRVQIQVIQPVRSMNLVKKSLPWPGPRAAFIDFRVVARSLVSHRYNRLRHIRHQVSAHRIRHYMPHSILQFVGLMSRIPRFASGSVCRASILAHPPHRRALATSGRAR